MIVIPKNMISTAGKGSKYLAKKMPIKTTDTINEPLEIKIILALAFKSFKNTDHIFLLKIDIAKAYSIM